LDKIGKVLVTGNLGYVGTVVSNYFDSKGYDVVGLDTGYYKDFVVPNSKSIKNIFTNNIDVREELDKVMEGIDFVVHLAALSNDPLGEKFNTVTDEINFRATKEILLAASRSKVKKFVFASSCSIYGQSEEKFLTEESVMSPQTAYAHSKVNCEKFIMQYKGDMTVTCLRFSTAYGFSPRMRFDIVINNLVGCALSTGKIVILSDGTPWRPMVHVEDMAHAFWAVIETESNIIDKQIYNIGREEDNYQIKDLAKVVQSSIENTEIEIRGQGESDERSYNVSFEKIRSQISLFNPKWNVPAGTLDLVNQLVRANFNSHQYDSYRYIRLKNIEKLMNEGRINNSLFWVKQ